MKKILLLLAMSLLPMITMADAVEIDGIWYNLVSKTKTAEVAKKPSGKYSDAIVIPEKVTYVGTEYSVTSIGEMAFFICSGLTSVTIPNSVTTIGDIAFSGCSGLTSITIPNSVTSIGGDAFEGCSGLTSITIPNSVTSIGWSAFSFCSGLTSVTIPNSVTSIGYWVFYRCTGLTSVTIPNSVTSIGASAFEGCSGLTSVTIGNSVKNIDDSAFAKCPELTDVTCLAETVPSTDTDAFEDSYIEYATLHVPETAINAYKTTAPWSGFKSVEKMMPTHRLTYIVDGEEYKSYEIEEGATISPEPAPTKEGCTFSGWSEIPETMPAHDVTVTGSFVPNKYQLTYKVDGEVYKSYNIEYGAIITPEPAPTKEGYTFSGWSEIPATMPDHDVTVTGTFTINKYKLIYLVDGELYKSFEIEHGATITPEPAPIKEGYTFSGWSWIPNKMPAEDVTVTGSFTINMYKLTYMVDNEVYKSYEIEYGATITPEPAPTKEGYSFTGWSWIPNKMPAEDVIVTGSFSINKYKLTYIVDGEVYKSYNIEYGASITPETEPTKEGFTFSGWSWIPTKMPAEDVSVSGYFNVNQYTITYIIDNEVYMTEKVDYGSTITPPTPPSREGYDFAWGDYPETMPAYDITIYGTYTTGVNAIWAGENSNAKIYSINGKQLEKPQKGLNIIRMSDGTTKKVVVK